MPRTPIVGGNWKCNPDSKSKLDGLIENINKCDTSACEVYVCPSPLHVDCMPCRLATPPSLLCVARRAARGADD
jgi:triosephosphate isomerase